MTFLLRHIIFTNLKTESILIQNCNLTQTARDANVIWQKKKKKKKKRFFVGTTERRRLHLFCNRLHIQQL